MNTRAARTGRSAGLAGLMASTMALAGCVSELGPCPGYALCGDACVSLAEDPVHCGQCGNRCPVACSQGRCVGVEQIVVGASLHSGGGNYRSACVRLEGGAARCLSIESPTLQWRDVLDVAEVAAGRNFVCLRMMDGSVRCRGDNQYDQLGRSNEDLLPEAQLKPTSFFTETATQLALADTSVCALGLDGGVQCWGRWVYQNEAGYLRDFSSPQPARLELTDGASHVSGGGLSTFCALLLSASVECWGDFFVLPTPLAIPAPARSVVAGAGHVCALLEDGSVVCGGANEHGQHGRGFAQTGGDATMYPVPGISGARSIAAGGSSTCVVLSDHSVSCWGRNDEGQLAIPGGQDLLVPTPIPGLQNVASIALGSVPHGCAALRSGAAVCWNVTSVEPQPLRFDVTTVAPMRD